MAQYHLRMSMISRSLGREPKPGGLTRNSVVAAASYRSGERLHDPTIEGGRWFNYKNDVVHNDITAPDMPTVPDWVLDRQSLWVMVERSEKRKDAALARECEVMLPRELSPEQRIELVRGFVKEVFCQRGMVADWALHCPAAADGAEHCHAHILLTTRLLDFTSPTGFSAKKELDWEEPAGVKAMVAAARKQFNNTGLEADKLALEQAEYQRNIFQWRQAWEVHVNRALEAAGSEARIDHRTLEKQGILRLPIPNLGIARHIEKAYDYIKDRVTHWVSIKKRASLYEEMEHIKARSDPQTLTEFVMQLGDMAESFAAQFRRPPKERPEVPLER